MTVQTVLRTTASGTPVKTVGDVPDCFKGGARGPPDCFTRPAGSSPVKTLKTRPSTLLKTVGDVPDCFNRGAAGSSP